MDTPRIQDSIYWVEVDRIKPNPFQPRKTFDEAALQSLAESIRSYGILQPLTVTRKEIEREDKGISVEYELIAGERRLRASKIAGIAQVPVVIRTSEDTDRMKLELAIIENLQREDLNPLDRAKAFRQLADQFGLQHKEIGLRVGKSREYVSNTMRMLLLPVEIQTALEKGEISEGHTRPLLMLAEKPDAQNTLFREIVERRLTVRDAEALARRAAVERVRHRALVSPDLMSLEKDLSERLGTRVRIEKKNTGGKVLIDFFSPEDLTQICIALAVPQKDTSNTQSQGLVSGSAPEGAADASVALGDTEGISTEVVPEVHTDTVDPPQVAQSARDTKESDDLYSISNFSV